MISKPLETTSKLAQHKPPMESHRCKLGISKSSKQFVRWASLAHLANKRASQWTRLAQIRLSYLAQVKLFFFNTGLSEGFLNDGSTQGHHCRKRVVFIFARKCTHQILSCRFKPVRECVSWGIQIMWSAYKWTCKLAAVYRRVPTMPYRC